MKRSRTRKLITLTTLQTVENRMHFGVGWTALANCLWWKTVAISSVIAECGSLSYTSSACAVIIGNPLVSGFCEIRTIASLSYVWLNRTRNEEKRLADVINFFFTAHVYGFRPKKSHRFSIWILAAVKCAAHDQLNPKQNVLSNVLIYFFSCN